MGYYVYVLKNTQTEKVYIGQTGNLKERIKRHNGQKPNKLSSFTNKNKGEGIWKVVYLEVFKTRKEAIIREKELKSSRGRQFLRDHIRAASSVGRAIAS